MVFGAQNSTNYVVFEHTDSTVPHSSQMSGILLFKKRYRDYPYYPVISFCSKSDRFVHEIADILKKRNFRLAELYNYRVKDNRVREGFTQISRIDLNGKKNLEKWLKEIGFQSPKHLKKIGMYWK